MDDLSFLPLRLTEFICERIIFTSSCVKLSKLEPLGNLFLRSVWPFSTGVPILYIDGMVAAQKSQVFADSKSMLHNFDSMIVASYKLLGRLDDIWLTTKFAEPITNFSAAFSHLKSQAMESSATGYYFLEHSDHMATTPIPNKEKLDEMVQHGMELLNQMADTIDMPRILEEMKTQEEYLAKVYEPYPHVPGAFNNR